MMDSEDTKPIINVLPEKEVAPPLGKKRLLTVEPVIVLYAMYYATALLIAEQYVFSVESEQYNYTEHKNLSACASDNDSMHQLQLQEEVQSKSSYVILLITMCWSILAMVSTLFIGAYSDTGGRKTAILIPILGGLIKCLTFVIVIWLKGSYWYLIIGFAIEGVSGGITATLMGCFSYIADVSTHKGRTLRVTILEVCIGIAMAISMSASGYMIEALGFLYPFIALVGINFLNIAYIVFLLPETRVQGEPIKNLFRISMFTKPFRLFITNDGTKRRWKLQLLMFTMIVVAMASLAKMDPTTYFLKGQPLCFNPVQIGYYAGGSNLALNLGSLLAVKLLINRIEDLWLMAMGCVSGAASMVLFAFSTQIWMVALVPVIGCLGYLTVPIVRGYSSKLVTPDEQGALFAAIAFAEALSNLIGVTGLDAAYAHTLYIMPGFVFIIMAGIYLAGLSLTCLQLWLTKWEVKKELRSVN